MTNDLHPGAAAPDLDPQETAEWRDAFAALIAAQEKLSR